MQRIALFIFICDVHIHTYIQISLYIYIYVYISEPLKSPVLSDASFMRGNFGKTRRVNKLPVVVIIESDTDYDNSPCHLDDVV